MPSECAERKPAKAPHSHHAAGAPLQEQEHLPCPRCDSTNTKFCYYNNYNFSQPRHFCKSCRRYWTHGGTLRDIPVGGGSRKNAKRSRTVSSSSSSAVVLHGVAPADHPSPAASLLLPFAAGHGGSVHLAAGTVGGDDGKPTLNVCGSFTSLLNAHGPPGFLALGGFGLGLGPGGFVDDVAFGLGKGVWPFQGVGDGGGAVVGSNGGGPGGIGNMWQLDSSEDGGLAGSTGGGDSCFPWPGLAISTAWSGLK